MGRVAQALADRVVVTNDNPRSEDPLRIAQAIAAGCSGDGVHIELDRAEAIRYAIRSAKTGDTVLVAGKGHENYQHIGTERRPFSDVVCAEQALREREGALQ
jgi:UDP-N-acetylmuramoyl-L-alanyl-D-glutamate--2,6-diaminopimelate ligase